MRVALRTHALAIAAWLWAAAYLVATRMQPLRMNWGDPWSDGNVMTSGRYFAKYGFVRLAFTPIIDVGPLDAESMRYTHYPPLPDVMNGVQQRIFGEADISTYRILADVLTLASLVFVYRWVRSLWGAVTANVTIALLTTSILWLQYADTIHHIPLYWFAGFGALDLASVWIDEREGDAKKRRRRLVMIGAATFMCNMASYDYFFFIPLLIAATLWMKGHRLRDRAMRPLLAAVVGGVVVAVLLKFSLVAWAVGPRNFVEDFFFQLQERATSKHSTEYRRGLWPIFFYRSLRFFTPLFFVVLVTQLVALVGRIVRHEDGDAAARLPPASPLFVLLAGVPFVAIFSQLFVEQYHPTTEFLPYYAIGVASVIAWLWERRSRVARTVAVVALLFAVGWEARELAAFEKTFLERDDAEAVHRYLAQHDTRRVVLTNAMVDAPFRYYFERHVIGVGHVKEQDVQWFVANFLDEDGDGTPVHFIQFPDVEKTAFDKLLYALFSREQKWSWIANPAPHKHEWLEIVKRRDAGVLAALENGLGRVVVETGRMRVWAIDRASLDRFQLAEIGPNDTRVIELGDPLSPKFKVAGFRYSEATGPGEAHAWTIERQPSRYRFTLHGLTQPPTGPSSKTAVLRFRAAPAKSKLTLIVYGGAPDQDVEVALNGTVVGRAPVIADWKELTFEIPREVFDASGIQKLELTPSKLNEHKLGVALRRVKMDPIVQSSP